MIDDSLLHNLSGMDAELGFIALVNTLDKWLGEINPAELDVARETYGGTVQAYIDQREIDVVFPRRRDYSTVRNWWDDFILDIWSFKAKCIFRHNTGDIPAPNPDLPDEIKTDYQEAKAIVSKSARGAAALLRLAIQKLCKELGEPGKNINDDIASLVRKGLPIRIQQALDIVRVIGNEAVHPGQMDVSDNPAIAVSLFRLVNLIAQHMISEPKAIAELYSSLPPDKLKGIKDRDRQGDRQN
jgi:hypothetical protein